ncbi:MAG TPA: hypothetical protein VE964_02315 [Myxococcales bacterium]|nr:hypothetical protein [Myxococcales bacterium]
MKRALLLASLVLLPAGAARAEDGSIGAIPELRITPGAGIGLVMLSAELNVEWRRFYAGAQLALAGATSAGVASYSGVRAGAFLGDGPNAPLVGFGLGGLWEADSDSASSANLAASAEIGMALRRDERWFHPQFVLQGILPLSQRANSTSPFHSAPVVLLGARIFL